MRKRVMPSLRRRRRCCAPLSGVVDVVAGQPRTHVKAIAELTCRLAACLRLAVEAGELTELFAAYDWCVNILRALSRFSHSFAAANCNSGSAPGVVSR